MRVLLGDGSGLTSRHVANRLWTMGHQVGVLTSSATGITRFTRAITGWHRVPPFGADPVGWLERALTEAHRGRYEILFPTQEHVTVLAWAADRRLLGDVRTVVPAFQALRKVQDKVAATRTLTEVAVPQPPHAICHDQAALLAWDDLPAFVKLPVGTASSGIFPVTDRDELVALTRRPAIREALQHDGLVVQAEAPGPLVMAQAVFHDGQLVAFHAVERLRAGARGGASRKQSLPLQQAVVVRDHLARLGAHLRWHGALSVDAILGPEPVVIDVNPRLVEPMSAWHAGVDLVAPMLDLACGEHPPTQPLGPGGTRTHQLPLALLGICEQGGTRRDIARELHLAGRHTGPYQDSHEELTPVVVSRGLNPRTDWRALAPTVAVSAATLLAPAAWRWFAGSTVGGYAITPSGWRRLTND